MMSIDREIELLENLIKESQEKIETLRRAAASSVPKLERSSMLRVCDRNGASYEVACYNSGDADLLDEDRHRLDWDYVASVAGPLRYETPDEREARGAVAVPLHGVYVVRKDELDNSAFQPAAPLVIPIDTQMEREENTDG